MRSTHSRTMWLAAAVLSALSLAGPSQPAFAEITFELVKGFESTAHPLGYPSALVVGSDGALYGVTGDGGSSDVGTVFRVDSAGTFTSLHSFSGTDGAWPSHLVAGSDGALYGTTGSGGSSGSGTVFRVDSAGNFTSLHSFSGSDGSRPHRVLERDGAVFGMTSSAGPLGRGTLFRIDRDGIFTTLHSFPYEDPPIPNGLGLGRDGSLYGVTYYGRLFRFDGAGTFTYFASLGGVRIYPTALVVASDGTLYVTAGNLTDGFTGDSGGTIFKIDSAGRVTNLHSFSREYPRTWAPIALSWNDGVLYGTVYTSSGTMVFGVDGTGAYTELLRLPDGAWPSIGRRSDGAFYGVTSTTVFQIDGAGTVTSLHSFSSADGARPSRLALGSDGALYGATTAGGSSDLGTIFRIDNAGTFTLLHSFAERYAPPFNNLLLGNDGALYSHRVGGSFRIDVEGTVSVLPVRWSDGFSGSEFSPAVLGTDGAFYWTESISAYFGPHLFGVFKVDSAGNGTVLHLDSGSSCSSPGLVLGSDGALYGTCQYGGASGLGTVFRIDNAGNFSTLHSFDYTDDGYPLDGAYPSAALAPGSDGVLYGTTQGGGSFGSGTVFKIDSAGAFASLHSFDGTDGAVPLAALVLGSDGALYGTTHGGGSFGSGTVFKIDSAGAFVSLHSFSGTDGIYPSTALVLGSGGALYGATPEGGSFGAGTVFKIDSAGAFASLHSFDGTDGAYPSGAWPSSAPPLLVGSDCALYGTATRGGPGGGGVVYRLFEAGHLCQRIDFDPLPNRRFGDPPFTVGATASSELPVAFHASGSCSVSGDQVFLIGGGLCTLRSSQVGDADYEPATDVSQAFHVYFDFTGFLPPVESPPAVNRVNAGRVVPVAFELAGDPGPGVLEAALVRRLDCDTLAPEGGFEPAASPGTSAPRSAESSGRYALRWKTQKSWAGSCRELALELVDGSVHRAYFHFGDRPRQERRRD